MTVQEAAVLIGAVGSVAQAIVVAVGARYALKQLAEARRASGLNAALDMFKRIHNPRSSDLRARLYRDIGRRYPDVGPDEIAVMEEVISDMYYIGYLVEERFVEFSSVAELYYGTAIRVWRSTWRFIEDERVRRGTPYAHYFEALYKRCLSHAHKYHKDRYPIDT